MGLWSKSPRCGAGFGAALALVAAALPESGRGETSRCRDVERVKVVAGTPWRCTANLEAGRTYLLRVDRQVVDITLRLTGPTSGRDLQLDSPTRRAGPELLLYRAATRGEYELTVSTIERGVPAATVEVQVREVPRAVVDSAAGVGLTALTSAASAPDELEPADALRRIELLQAALPGLTQAPEIQAEVRLRIAATWYWIVNDWTKAASTAQEAMQVFERLGDGVMTAQAATIRGAALAELAGTTRRRAGRAGDSSVQTQFAEARRLLESAASEFSAADMAYDEAHALNNLGVAFHYEGRFAEARANYLRAAQLFGRAQEHSSRVLPLQNVASLDYEAGNYLQAITSYEGLLGQLDPQGDASNYVAILNNLGTAQSAVGNTDTALRSLSAALPLTAGDAFIADRARTLHGLGRTYLIVGDMERGGTFLEQALALRRTLGEGDRRGLLSSLLRNGDLQRERGSAADALKLHLQALDYAVSPQEKTRVLFATGLDQMARGDTDGAIEMYRRALELDLPEDWPERVSVTGGYGYALMHKGDARGAALILQSAAAHEKAGDDELAAHLYYLLAAEERRAGRLESALRDVDKALALYESQRIRALNPDLRATYVATRSAVYELQAETLMSLAERTTDVATRRRLQSAAIFAAESLRVRALSDFREFAQSTVGSDVAAADRLLELDARLAAKRHRLSTVLDLQNPSAESVAALRRDIALLRTELDLEQARQPQRSRDVAPVTGATSLEQLQRSIERDSVIVTWLLGEDRSWIWCLTRDQAVAYPLAGRQLVERAARELYGSWSRVGASSPDADTRASSAILGKSAPQFLTGKRGIVVVADGILRSLPLGALYVTDAGGGAKRIADTHDVSYRPSLNRWHAPGSQPTRVGSTQRILLVGDPVRTAGPATGPAAERQTVIAAGSAVELPPLPGSRREIAGIVDLAGGWQAQVLLGERATKAAVLAEPLEQFRVLHFATHARLDVRDPQLSAIVLSGPLSAAGNEAALTLREIVGMRLNSDAVVLSACEGSLGKDYRGQLSLGLSEAFLLGGSRTVLGGLWRVSDAATERYMRAFYTHYLSEESSVAVAAQAAARTLMRDPVFSDPYFWAAFVVVGG